MNVNQIKTKIFILKSVDTILIVGLIAMACYSAFYSSNKEMMLIYCLIGLFLVNTLGRYTSKKIALMRIQIDMTEREKKKEEQRTLMRTRHTTVR
jgi:phenylacetate-coenzyme A ligase PaaK-like adenylate-forming protein